MKISIVIVCFFYCSKCFAQTYSEKDFIEVPLFKYGSAEWLRINTIAPDKNFLVYMENGHLRIKHYRSTAAKELKVATGRFIALDNGEWGGNLYFKSNDTLKQAIVVNGFLRFFNKKAENYTFTIFKKDTSSLRLIKGNLASVDAENTTAIIPYKTGWLSISGLAHMSFNYGSLNHIFMQNDTFLVTKNFIFKSAPSAIACYKNKIFVATSNSFYCLNEHYEQELFLDGFFWRSLGTNSIAVHNKKHIYIGLHAGYAEINTLKKTVKYYVYRDL